mmetsp:Transcript_4874/g.9949  ORF Transcript_4874/g.9949 Transcript_4874/m.9949 type:complete len:88 (-) Transcript_4874:323-586(-)
MSFTFFEAFSSFRFEVLAEVARRVAPLDGRGSSLRRLEEEPRASALTLELELELVGSSFRLELRGSSLTREADPREADFLRGFFSSL